ncbi:MAG: formylglycine-generating enzyme family protein [Chloroflexota bacterium]
MWLILISILLVTASLHAQADDEVLDEALAGARAFTGGNADWQPFTHTFANDPTGAEMMLVPVGAFMMGSTEAEIDAALAQCNASDPQSDCNRVEYEDEAPAHTQQITQPYWIDRDEVTRAQYDICVQAGACPQPPPSRYSTEPDHPVNRISWFYARDYCEWRGGRLPTELEWEFAARGPDSLTYPWGDDADGNRANHCDERCIELDTYLRYYDAGNDDGYAAVAPVGTYDNASWVGARDMAGNIYEWTGTIYDNEQFTYPYVPDDGRNDFDDPEAKRVLRGGARVNSFVNLRSANRNGLIAPDADFLGFYGMRCMRESE